jgi:hypothetical protein
VRPGEPGTQRQRRVRVERQQAVEAGAELAARVGRGAAVVAERKTAAVDIGLAVGRRAEALRLDRRKGAIPPNKVAKR